MTYQQREAQKFIEENIWLIVALLLFVILYTLGKIWIGKPFFP